MVLTASDLETLAVGLLAELPLPGIEGRSFDSGAIWQTVEQAAVDQKLIKAVTDPTRPTYSDDYTLTQLHTIRPRRAGNIFESGRKSPTRLATNDEKKRQNSQYYNRRDVGIKMRNIVLVTVDSLRADHCGFMGYRRDTTPTLDRMASEGVVFENAIAPGGKTPESMPVIFTEQFPFSRTKDASVVKWKERILPHMKARDTIPERLTRQGYETIAFTANTFTSRYFGFDEGFDRFTDFLDEEFRPSVAVPNFIRAPIKWFNKEGSFKPWTAFYDDILRHIDAADQPYLLWIFLMDAHVPYFVPRKYRTENSLIDMLYANWRRGGGHKGGAAGHKKIVSAYDDAIRFTDDFFGRLQHDLADTNPIFVIHGDHGEAFGEHGSYGHSGLLYEENIHVPFIIGNIDETTRISDPVSLRRVPSILDSLAEKASVTTWAERTVNDLPIVSRTETGHRYSVRNKQYKMIHSENGNHELYNLRNDPDEQNNLVDDHRRLAEEFDQLGQLQEKTDQEKGLVNSGVLDLELTTM